MPRVILVDDDIRYRRALTAFLDASFDIDVVGDTGDAEEAIALVRKLEPDAAVIDVAMPGVNGVDLAGRIREVLQQIVIVLVTGDIGGVDPARAHELGATLLPKGDPLPVENALRTMTRR
jgi:two-component system nitrate/nitrite response regulator NarL